MAQALPVLNLRDKTFEIGAEAFKSVLAKVGNRPFAVISINGPTRTGKSYSLSHFVRYFESKKTDPENTNWYDNPSSSKFVWRGGIERTTTGMDLWSEPYFVKTPEGEEIAVLLIDTQGLFDAETSARQNAIIFSISTLCSSVMIFNIMRMIDENILQQVEFFSGYAHMAAAYEDKVPNEKGNKATVEKNDSNSPHGSNMLFLLRDFELENFEFGLHTPTNSKPNANGKENLYSRIFNLEGRHDCPAENKIVRENILRNFRNVSLYCLPDPGKQFKRSTSAGVDPIPDEDFKENVIAFVEHMVKPENLVKKTVLDVPTTGLEFQKYIDMWANMCKDAQDKFPDVLTVADNTSFTQYSIALNLAVSKYKNDMDVFVRAKPGSLSPEELEAFHSQLVKDAETIFFDVQVRRNPKFEDKFKQDLAANIERCYQFAKDSNDIYREIIANNEKNEQVLNEKMKEMDSHMAEERQRMDGVIRGFQDSNESLREMTNRLKEEAEAQELMRKKEKEEMEKRMAEERKRNEEAIQAERRRAENERRRQETLRKESEDKLRREQALQAERQHNENVRRENEIKLMMEQQRIANEALQEVNASLRRKHKNRSLLKKIFG